MRLNAKRPTRAQIIAAIRVFEPTRLIECEVVYCEITGQRTKSGLVCFMPFRVIGGFDLSVIRVKTEWVEKPQKVNACANEIRYCYVCAVRTIHVLGKSRTGYTCYQCVKCRI